MRPLFVYPTLKATSTSMMLTQKEFPNKHGGNNRANAFRHGLWNILLVQELLKWSGNIDKVIQFTTIVTNWHEDFAPNKPLEKTMDLHNNAVGRKMILSFLENHKKMTTAEIITALHNKLKSSVQISPNAITSINTDEFVYLEN